MSSECSRAPGRVERVATTAIRYNPGTVMLSRRHAPSVVVAAIVIVSAVFRFAAATRFATPWIAPDEAIYGILGRSFWETGHMSVLGADTAFYGLYPLLPGLPLALLGATDGVTATQVLQALLMSGTAALAYGWARQATTPWWAVGAAALTAAMPALAYSGLLMSEAAFLPVATLTLWMLTRALVEPTLARQALAGGLVVLTALTRLQGTVFVAIAITAIVVTAALGRDRSLLRRFLPTLVVFAVLGGVGIVAALVSSDGSGGVLGAYGDTASGGYEAGEIVRWVFRHAADVYLLVLGVPLLALAVLLVEAARGRERDPAVRALLAVSASTLVWVVLQVGVFASRFVGGLAERDLVTVVPPLFVVLVVWLGREMPRPQPLTSIAAVVVVAPAVLLPIKDLATPIATPDAFMLVPFVRLAESASGGTLQTVWLVGVAATILVAVFLPARAAAAVVGLGAATLLVASVVASDEIADRSHADRSATFGDADPAWIDAAGSGDVVYLYDGDTDWTGLWRHVFWNERITRVASPPVPPGPVPGPETTVAPSSDGALRDSGGEPLAANQVVAPVTYTMIGDRGTTITQGLDLPGLALWDVPGTAQVSTSIAGLQPNGDILAPVRVSVFSCAPGRLELTLLGKQGLPVRLSVDGRLVETADVPVNTVWHGAVPAPRRADGRGRCVFEIASDGLVGSTRIEYVRNS
jgi:hypothetical protein